MRMASDSKPAAAMGALFLYRSVLVCHLTCIALHSVLHRSLKVDDIREAGFGAFVEAATLSTAERKHDK